MGKYKMFITRVLLLTVISVLASSSLVSQQESQDKIKPGVRERFLMDFGWRFAFGHPCKTETDFNHATSYFSYMTKAGYGDGPASANFDDRSWRVLNLPHDWAVEQPFDPKAGYSHGYKTIGRNFPETSVGWYRKTFSVPESDLGRRIIIEFDGVHRNSIVWVNGFYLGEEHSGYSNFQYDITDYLNYGGRNIIAVRVDVTIEEGWYYEGAGIYRHVWLNKTPPLNIAPYGIFVSTELHEGNAKITARTTVQNQESTETLFDIEQTIVDAKGKFVASRLAQQLKLKPSEREEYFCKINIDHPRLWSLDAPYLYRIITKIKKRDSIIDFAETTFGIRTIRFDPNEGFFLNGNHVILKGTNNHQDHAGVGTAIPDALQEFRIKRLKEMGSNAYRCSHNPATPELLDVCDRLGMLVLDENRLMGTNAEHLDLLKRMILHDRNHPCILAWSLGNEEWAIEGNVLGARITSTMQAFAHQLDSSRSVTTAISGGCGNGTSQVLDIMGFNYLRQCDIDDYHKKFPDRPSMGTEETTSRGTRGIYRTDSTSAHMMATDRVPSGQSIEEGFRFYADRPFLAGLFFWTGFDYRGEPHPYGWPQVTSQSGIVDLCGFPKDQFYFLKSWWTDEPVLHLLPHWNWKGNEGKPINVWAYSNCDEVELFLNNKSLGRKTMPKNSNLEWIVDYRPGTLLAHGYRNTKEVITDKIETAGEVSGIQLIPDRALMNADGEDVLAISVKLNDSKGIFVPTSNNEITFSLEGPGTIIGVGNGDPSSHEQERYLESVSQVRIENLKAMASDGNGISRETSIDFNDSRWKPALTPQGEYNVQATDTLKTVVIRGTFNVPELTDDGTIKIWPKSLCEEQSVYINGHLLAKGIKRNDAVQEFILDHALLHEGKNVYALVGSPLVPRYLYDNLNNDPGIIQIVIPAKKWKRKVFNGLAQILVQSKKMPGEIILTATSEGIVSATLKILTTAVVPRPAVPVE
jgi:beta-galactosidase